MSVTPGPGVTPGGGTGGRAVAVGVFDALALGVGSDAGVVAKAHAMMEKEASAIRRPARREIIIREFAIETQFVHICAAFRHFNSN